MKRSESREQAFILIFERSFKEESIDEIIEEAVIGRNLEVDDYAYNLAKEVTGHLPWLDESIAVYSKKWKINRMSRVALSIIRMSLWEIDHIDTVPIGASINEAVELAKKYGSADDFSFVNGVLGAYVRGKGQEIPEAVEAERAAEASLKDAKAEEEAVDAAAAAKVITE
ncbi:transcription antitermination factor NusB [Oscillospiraceae bacterium PP1C4]